MGESGRPRWPHKPEIAGPNPAPATTPRRVNRTGAPGLLAKQIVSQGMGFECSALRLSVAGIWIVDPVGRRALVRSEMEPRGLGFDSSAIRLAGNLSYRAMSRKGSAVGRYLSPAN